MSRFVLNSLLVFLAALLFVAPAALAEVKEGDAAPAFELAGSDGKTHKLSDYIGKQAVVIAWYPKAFTGGCTNECKSLRQHGEAIRKFNVAYFTASCDDAETNKKFAESLELDYPILSDPSRKLSDPLGVTDAQQMRPRRWTIYIGKDGKILHIDKAVKTMSHGTDVAAKLKELGIDAK
jgi:peroxiredoxin Q/BCP